MFTGPLPDKGEPLVLETSDLRHWTIFIKRLPQHVVWREKTVDSWTTRYEYV